MADNAFITVDAAGLRKFHRALRDIDKVEARALSKRLREKAEPLATKVRAAALKLPETSTAKETKMRFRKGQRMGFRQGLAYAVETRVNSSRNGGNVRIRVSGTKFARATGGYRKLPRYMEGLGKRPWRHPVFADKGVRNGSWKGAWAEQKPQPFLLPTVLPHKDEIRRALIAEYEDTFAKHLKGFGVPVR